MSDPSRRPAFKIPFENFVPGQVLPYCSLTPPTPRRSTWIAAVLEIEGGICVLCGIIWFLYGFFIFSIFLPLSASALIGMGLLLIAPMAVGVGLVISGMGLRHAVGWAVITGTLLTAFLVFVFAWDVTTLIFNWHMAPFEILPNREAFVLETTLMTFQAIMLFVLIRHYIRSRREHAC